MPENKPEEKKGYCGSGRCCWTGAMLAVLALMALSSAIGFLMGKSCGMGRMACINEGMCAHGGMAGMSACPMMGGGAAQEPAKK